MRIIECRYNIQVWFQVYKTIKRLAVVVNDLFSLHNSTIELYTESKIISREYFKRCEIKIYSAPELFLDSRNDAQSLSSENCKLCKNNDNPRFYVNVVFFVVLR